MATMLISVIILTCVAVAEYTGAMKMAREEEAKARRSEMRLVTPPRRAEAHRSASGALKYRKTC